MSTPSKSKTSASRQGAGDTLETDSGQSTPSATSKGAKTAGTNAGRSKPARTTSANATPVSARAAVKKPPGGPSNATSPSDELSEADARAQTASAMEELQTSLRLSQEACEGYQKQIALLQSRAKTSADEYRQLEESTQELHERIEAADSEKRELVRSKRELESAYEADRTATLNFQKEAKVKEEEMAETIRRLKDTNAQRVQGEDGGRPDTTRRASSRSARSTQVEGAHFAPPSSVQRSDSRSSSRLIHQKDKMIESLRLELAESQIKIVEMENRGGGQVQELEKHLMESRMTNARLMEENESFQLLLSEKTLNGDLAHSGFLHRTDTEATPTTAVRGSTLEDELRSAEDDDHHDSSRDLRSQVATLKEENKALTLYINRIISRLLQHDFDFMFDENTDTPTHKFGPGSTQKDLPPPPSEPGLETPGLLSRTRSLIGSRRPRPQSVYTGESSARPTVHEDPDTAPSIPIGRPSQRTTSGDVRRQTASEWNSAAVVNNMYRGISPSRSTSGPISPGLTSPRDPFSATRPPNTTRVTSGSTFGAISEDGAAERKTNRDSRIASRRDSISSDTSNFTSPARSGVASSDKAANSVMMGTKIRPLRLVQEQSDEAAAKKAANRMTWMGGWFNKGTGP